MLKDKIKKKQNKNKNNYPSQPLKPVINPGHEIRIIP
jgi:hypothetical protein